MVFTNTSTGKEIRNLLLVLGSGIGVAVLVALCFLYYYNPSGTYLARNVLLAPESASVMSFNDLNPKTGSVSRFVFDGIEFRYFSKDQKLWKKIHVDIDKYNQFYQMISNLSSLSEVPEEVQKLFNRPYPASLVLRIRTESNAQWQSTVKDFIEVSFAYEGDYFRIELHEQNSSGNWAYFYFPKVYNKVIDLFIP